MSCSRRSVLLGIAATTAASLCGGCGINVDAPPSIAGKLDENPASANYAMIAVSLAENPALLSAGGALIVTVSAGNRPFMVPSGGVLLLRRTESNSSDDFVAVDALCPHAGCPLGYAKQDDVIACPCHGSTFLAVGSATECIGALQRGPAKSSVQAFLVTLDKASQTVYIDLRSSPSCGSFTPTVSGGKVTLPFVSIPDLMTVGGSWTGAPQGLGDTLIVFRQSATVALALSAICTHQRCLVGLNASKSGLFCPCHQSSFTLAGAVTGGPAPTALKKYTATVMADSVVVTVV